MRTVSLVPRISNGAVTEMVLRTRSGAQHTLSMRGDCRQIHRLAIHGLTAR